MVISELHGNCVLFKPGLLTKMFFCQLMLTIITANELNVAGENNSLSVRVTDITIMSVSKQQNKQQTKTPFVESAYVC